MSLIEAIKEATAVGRVGDEDSLGWSRQRDCEEGEALTVYEYLRVWLEDMQTEVGGEGRDFWVP